MNQLIEKTTEYNTKLYILLVDLKKAFDSVNLAYLWKSLSRPGLSAKTICIMKEIYNNTTAKIKLNKVGDPTEIIQGVKQEDPLSPTLFNFSSNYQVFKSLNMFRRIISSFKQISLPVSLKQEPYVLHKFGRVLN